MAFEAAEARIERIIEVAGRRLRAHRAEGLDDSDFIEQLRQEFTAEGMQNDPGAGWLTMAVSVYRMVVQAEEIRRLSEAVDMRDATLKGLADIDRL